MPHGYPDWGRDDIGELLYGLPDMSELAARLWSPDTFNRHGHVIFMDGFEASLNKWIPQRSGLGAAAAITNEEARNGLCSCKLIAGSTLFHWAGIGHFQPYPVLSSMGFEISWHTLANIDAFQIEIQLDDGTDQLTYRVQWVRATQLLQYWTVVPPAPPAWVTFATNVNFPLLQSLFRTWKLVIDAPNQVYKYFIADNVNYPMTGLTPAIAGTFFGPSIYIWANNVGGDGRNDILYVDDAILTQHEP